MYTDYTIDDVLEAGSHFVQNLSDIFKDVNERCTSLEALYFDMLNQSFKQELLESTEKLINCEFKEQESFVINVNENNLNLDNLKSTGLKLKSVKPKKESECSNLEQKVTACRDKINYVLKKKENICKLRHKVLTLKVLTNVDFVYKTKKVSGLITKEVPETFTLNPQELSQEEITQTLWDLILKKNK